MKKSIHAGLFLLLFCLFFCGKIHKAQAEQTGENTVYYKYNLNKDVNQLEKEAYTPVSETLEEVLNDLILKIGSKNSDDREINLLPQEVNINSYQFQDQIMVIDFNSQYTAMGRTREILVRAGIVKTFAQFAGVQSVCFTVLGEDLTDSRRQVIGEMNENTFVEYSGTQEQKNYRQEILTLYFTNADGTGLVKENRKVYYKPSLQKERVVLEQLIKGPMEKSNYPTLPDNISVLSISTADEVCYVSLTQSFIDSALPIDGKLALYSIVNSLADSCGTGRVELSVEGKTDVIYANDISLYQFYEKNEELILMPAPTPLPDTVPTEEETES